MILPPSMWIETMWWGVVNWQQDTYTGDIWESGKREECHVCYSRCERGQGRGGRLGVWDNEGYTGELRMWIVVLCGVRWWWWKEKQKVGRGRWGMQTGVCHPAEWSPRPNPFFSLSPTPRKPTQGSCIWNFYACSMHVLFCTANLAKWLDQQGNGLVTDGYQHSEQVLRGQGLPPLST